MKGYKFEKQKPRKSRSNFDRLFSIFQDVLLHTSGDIEEALIWMNTLDREYEITDAQYSMADFIKELEERGYIQNGQSPGSPPKVPTAKMEKSMRQDALNQIFNVLKQSSKGQHTSKKMGIGTDPSSENRAYQFGDNLENIDITESLRNAQINHGIQDFQMNQQDLYIRDTYEQTQTSTVLMIDISHSMILYGEDRITPAKKVALALSEYITTRFPNDTLDVIVFGNDAWQIELKELPYLQVGPYHTNTVAGLELAIDILRKRKATNKQIFMITDGKPTCIKIGNKYYKNAFGLDRKILNRTLSLATKCRKLDIPITTFMIAKDPHLTEFVKQFTNVNQGKAFYSSLEHLGQFIFMDYKSNKRKR